MPQYQVFFCLNDVLAHYKDIQWIGNEGWSAPPFEQQSCGLIKSSTTKTLPSLKCRWYVLPEIILHHINTNMNATMTALKDTRITVHVIRADNENAVGTSRNIKDSGEMLNKDNQRYGTPHLNVIGRL